MLSESKGTYKMHSGEVGVGFLEEYYQTDRLLPVD